MVAIGGRGSLEPDGSCTLRVWCEMSNRDAWVLFSDEFDVRVTNQVLESVGYLLYSVLYCVFCCLVGLS